MTILLAVYGTLKRGFPNHGFLRGARFVGAGRTEARFTLFDVGGIPGVIEAGHTAIEVEVFEVSPATLHEIDLLEGHPHVYVRREVPLPGVGKAWMYVLVEPPLHLPGCDDKRRVITSGTWSMKPRAIDWRPAPNREGAPEPRSAGSELLGCAAEPNPSFRGGTCRLHQVDDNKEKSNGNR